MSFRTVVVTCLFLLALSLSAQNNGTAAGQAQCAAGTSCSNFRGPEGYPTLATRPASAPPAGRRWEIEDFKPVDSSISCAVVKYDLDNLMPILHLLCPGPQIFAPLRVHLTLTWKDVSEVPESMKNMLVDATSNSTVKFKSRPGESRVELTLRDPDDTQSLKEWVKFTKVNVGLVVPPQQ